MTVRFSYCRSDDPETQVDCTTAECRFVHEVATTARKLAENNCPPGQGHVVVDATAPDGTLLLALSLDARAIGTRTDAGAMRLPY